MISGFQPWRRRGTNPSDLFFWFRGSRNVSVLSWCRQENDNFEPLLWSKPANYQQLYKNIIVGIPTFMPPEATQLLLSVSQPAHYFLQVRKYGCIHLTSFDWWAINRAIKMKIWLDEFGEIDIYDRTNKMSGHWGILEYDVGNEVNEKVFESKKMNAAFRP